MITTDQTEFGVKEPKSLDGFYDPAYDRIDTSAFIEDIRLSLGLSRDKVAEYLSTSLKEIPIAPTYLESKDILPLDTSDENVQLMQAKLTSIDPTYPPLRDQTFLYERAYTISTFRMLDTMIPILALMGRHIPITEPIFSTVMNQLFIKQVASSDPNNNPRQDILDRNGVKMAELDSFFRRYGVDINTQGQVSKKEMGTIVLPRVKRILKHIAEKKSELTKTN